MIDFWFPTIIKSEILFKFKSLNDYFANKCYDCKQQFPYTVIDWRCDTYNTLETYDPWADKDQSIKTLIEECEIQVLDFSKEFGEIPDDSEIKCTEFWFNLSTLNSYQEYHNHPNSHFSAVYYVKTHENCGNIVFRDFNSFSDMYQLPIKKNTHKCYSTCYYVPQDSMLLVFRSNLWHMVEKNLSYEDRISISMNFTIKGKL